ncbi:MAG: dephospho-CoA kinase [Methyloligellaceae bacterium]
MIILGLTGSIGMGKSTASKRFLSNEIPVLDADKVVHDLYQGDAAQKIEEAFPGTVENGSVNREILAKYLIENPEDFKKLGAIIHPMVRIEEARFIGENLKAGKKIVVLEVPLLLEGNMDDEVDAVIVVHAEDKLRRERVMQRPGMTEEKLNSIIAKQMPEEKKLERADYIVDTSLTIEDTWRQIDEIIAMVEGKEAGAVNIWKKAHPDLIT